MFNEHIYEFSQRQKIGYDDAEVQCNKTGGYLLEIDTEDEQDAISYIMKRVINTFGNKGMQGILFILSTRKRGQKSRPFF